MDLDDGQKRPSTAHDRPSRIPLGPRRPKQTHDMDLQLERPPHQDVAVQTLPLTPTATFVPPPPLTPPPAISFEPAFIPWKGLPLEAAQWSFSSSELQEIVSKAIRLSARESFVRLLSLQALEVDIPLESQRLEAARLETQAKWRFEVARRTMLMHALNASAAFSSALTPASEHPPDSALGNPIATLVAQLATAIASCDSLFSTILHISDQQSQIALIQYQHWSSALGMALRKLNKAHERQAQELRDVQARVQTLEDELEEAWREAEKMAIEFDDLEHEFAETESERGSEAVDEGTEQDAAAHPPDPTPKHDPDETGTLGDITINTDLGVVLGVTATAVVSKATLVTSGSPKATDKSDTRSIRSVKSTRSRRSTRDGQSHFSRISSARMRSRAASNASLRLPKALRSTPPTHSSPDDDAPPMPALPSSTAQGQQSFLDMDNVMNDHLRKSLPPRHPEPTTALPTPPHSAGLPETRVPSIWLETDAGKSTQLNALALDRSNSLSIFSSLAQRKMRRSNLVMSLTGSDHSSEEGVASPSGSPSLENSTDVGQGQGLGHSGTGTGKAMGMGTRTPSPTLNHSPVSLPTRALAHFRGPSVSSSSHNMGVRPVAPRPGSAGARLTTTGALLSVGPKKSLVSRASSVILRRLSRSQATTTTTTAGGDGKGSVSGKSLLASPSKSREASRLSGSGRTLVERWKDRTREGDGPRHRIDESKAEAEAEGEGEVMLIGSPHIDPFDAP